MPDRRLWRHFDYWILFAVIVLLLGGVAMVYSASRGDPVIERTPVDQAVTALAGLIVLLLISLIDYTLLKNVSWLLYLGTLIALGAVLVVGAERFGARRWFEFGGFDVQPGELAKLSLGIFLAHFIADRQGRRPYLETVILSALLLLPCLGLILLQPNLSTAVTLVFMWLAIVYVGGLEREHAVIIVLAALAMLFIVFQLGLIEQYQITRIEQLLGINVEPGETYQADQALIALGSGGWTGAGFAQGQQSQLRFLPVRHTDFIFSVIGEELGFVGAVLFIAFLAFVIYRTLRAAWIARDTFGRLLCVSIAAVLFLQTYINLGMQVGIMPVTGVVLPFVSYGRSSLITALAAIGLVESVAMRYKKLEF
ncbi:MAG: FtsW/RodA/SpoVE family cell cycle protein [Anaerolineae bacterium]|nr:rod shape-determining protein RodA [Thermoflexales bacterium]MDW8408228.1 FtsW/RodA/SpoVE family cell cycle protein [Anaerolineae bacterium]